MAAWLGGGERGKGPRDLAALPILCPGQQRRLRRLLDLPHSAGTATRPQQPLLEQRTSNVDTHSHGDAPEPVDHVAALGWGLDRLTAALLGERRIFDVIDAERRPAGRQATGQPGAERPGAD